MTHSHTLLLLLTTLTPLPTTPSTPSRAPKPPLLFPHRIRTTSTTTSTANRRSRTQSDSQPEVRTAIRTQLGNRRDPRRRGTPTTPTATNASIRTKPKPKTEPFPSRDPTTQPIPSNPNSNSHVQVTNANSNAIPVSSTVTGVLDPDDTHTLKSMGLTGFEIQSLFGSTESSSDEIPTLPDDGRRKVRERFQEDEEEGGEGEEVEGGLLNPYFYDSVSDPAEMEDDTLHSFATDGDLYDSAEYEYYDDDGGDDFYDALTPGELESDSDSGLGGTTSSRREDDEEGGGEGEEWWRDPLGRYEERYEGGGLGDSGSGLSLEDVGDEEEEEEEEKEEEEEGDFQNVENDEIAVMDDTNQTEPGTEVSTSLHNPEHPETSGGNDATEEEDTIGNNDRTKDIGSVDESNDEENSIVDSLTAVIETEEENEEVSKVDYLPEDQDQDEDEESEGPVVLPTPPMVAGPTTLPLIDEAIADFVDEDMVDTDDHTRNEPVVHDSTTTTTLETTDDPNPPHSDSVEPVPHDHDPNQNHSRRFRTLTLPPLVLPPKLGVLLFSSPPPTSVKIAASIIFARYLFDVVGRLRRNAVTGGGGGSTNAVEGEDNRGREEEDLYDGEVHDLGFGRIRRFNPPSPPSPVSSSSSSSSKGDTTAATVLQRHRKPTESFRSEDDEEVIGGTNVRSSEPADTDIPKGRRGGIVSSIGRFLFGGGSDRYGRDEASINAEKEANEREAARVKEHDWMVERLQEVEAMLASVEATCEGYRLDCDERARELRRTQEQLETLTKTNAYLESRLAENRRTLSRAVDAERRRTNEELTRVRNSMAKVLERERRIMRAQIAKASGQVRSMMALEEERRGLASVGVGGGDVEEEYDDDDEEEEESGAHGGDVGVKVEGDDDEDEDEDDEFSNDGYRSSRWGDSDTTVWSAGRRL